MKTIGIITIIGIAAALLMAFSYERSVSDEDPEPLKSFDCDKYLGKWYEIARMDYKWEKNLSSVTATYTLKENGDIRVDNKGYNSSKQKWVESAGKAKTVGDPSEGRLKVSFCWPFWSEYNVIAVDPHYRHALVAGKNKKYLWILSREKILPESVKAEYLQKAREAGYNTDELTWIAHDKD